MNVNSLNNMSLRRMYFVTNEPVILPFTNKKILCLSKSCCLPSWKKNSPPRTYSLCKVMWNNWVWSVIPFTMTFLLDYLRIGLVVLATWYQAYSCSVQENNLYTCLFGCNMILHKWGQLYQYSNVNLDGQQGCT